MILSRRPINALFVFVLSYFFIISTIDVASFLSVQSGEYDTPWYDNRWWVSPYVNFIVAVSNPVIYTTKNAIGDTWLCKKAVINGKEWWTVLKITKKEEQK